MDSSKAEEMVQRQLQGRGGGDRPLVWDNFKAAEVAKDHSEEEVMVRDNSKAEEVEKDHSKAA